MNWRKFFLRLIIVFLCVLFILFQHTRYRLDDRLTVVFCSVGQGDATLIMYKSWQMLVDAGPSDKILKCLEEFMPMYDKSIELAVFTHPQEDHVGGFLEVLDFYRIDQIWWTNVNNDTRGYFQLLDKTAKRNIQKRQVFAHDKFIFQDIEVEVMWPSMEYFLSSTMEKESSNESKVDLNHQGIVMELRFGNFELLLTADVDSTVQPMLINEGLISDVDVLKVPHHGSKTGLAAEFLDIIQPELSVISSGKGNNFGHPHKEILSQLKNAKSVVMRTDIDGNVVVRSDGKKWWIVN